MNTTQPRQKQGVLSRKVGDEWILYDSEKGSVHVINATAERVWRLLDGAHTPDDLERELRAAFAAPDGAPVRRHVDAILKQFADLGVITLSPAPGSPS